MQIEITDRTRELLAQSLPLMEQRKDVLIDRLGSYLTGGDEDSEPAAIILTELMMGQAASLVRSGAFQDVRNVGQEHRRLGIQGRHYSRYGDALAPVIRDLLGPKVPREVAGAWGDAFWAIIRAAQACDEAVHA